MKNQRLFSPECSQLVSQQKSVQLSEAMLNLKNFKKRQVNYNEGSIIDHSFHSNRQLSKT